MQRKRGKPPKLSREAIRKRIGALPATSGGLFGPVTQRAALAAFFDLESRGSSVPEHVKKHESAIYAEIITKLEPIPGHKDSYVITPEMLRGLIKRAGHTAAAQAMLEIGGSLQHRKHRLGEVAYLKKLFTGNRAIRRATDESEPNIASDSV
jgi:hypothetical protein